MKKEIILIPSTVKLDKLRNYLVKGVDILALTPMAILTCENYRVPYKTPEDFYPNIAFRKDIDYLNKKTEQVFAKLDEICEENVRFPYAYSGNIYWFLCFFADLLYVERLFARIYEVYSNIYLVVDERPNKLSWETSTYPELKYILQAKGLESKIRILARAMPIELIQGVLEYPSSESLYSTICRAFIKKRKGIVNRLSQKKLLNFRKLLLKLTGDSCEKRLLVIQDGYEINYIKHYLPEFVFCKPMALIEKKIFAYPHCHYDFAEIHSRLSGLLETFFPILKPQIESLFLAYHREVVGRLSYSNLLCEESIEDINPKLIMFSASINQVIECLIAYKANQRNIPVICFQHGGAGIFVNHSYQKFLERNPRIKKILILNSKVEVGHAIHSGSVCVAFGSTWRFKTAKESKKRNGKILYCCGLFSFNTYKTIYFTASDKDCFKINRDVLKISSLLNLSIDVKIHPVEQEHGLNYFKELIRASGNSKARVIYGIDAEYIMKAYGLLILEFLPSGLFPLALAIKIPIILYLKDMRVANIHVLEDLKKRCYIVSDQEMLFDILRKYADGKLETKWSEEIVDRYVYPIENGNPGPNIAEYLKTLI